MRKGALRIEKENKRISERVQDQREHVRMDITREQGGVQWTGDGQRGKVKRKRCALVQIIILRRDHADITINPFKHYHESI